MLSKPGDINILTVSVNCTHCVTTEITVHLLDLDVHSWLSIIHNKSKSVHLNITKVCNFMDIVKYKITQLDISS